MKTFIPPDPPRHGIEITPLIDVVFILLLFFVLTSSFADPALRTERYGPTEVPGLWRTSTT
jgi:hypothetical protein